MLRKLGSVIPGAGEVVNEQLAKVGRGQKRRDVTPIKAKGKGVNAKSQEKSKKRKIKDVKSEEAEEGFRDQE
jgi:hypothetical protein